jgi:hypothetical protein
VQLVQTNNTSIPTALRSIESASAAVNVFVMLTSQRQSSHSATPTAA